MSTPFQIALGFRVIPVVSIENLEDTGPLADALIEGGLPSAEVVFRTNAALKAIAAMAARGDLIVGAGTVLTVEQADKAVEAGATFIVSPGFHPKVIRYCLDHRIPVLPGVCTPTDIGTALDHGLDLVKFFPAETFGGIKTLKAFNAPFPMVRFVPTGGISPQNLCDYLKLPYVVACGGTWMASRQLIASKRFDEIRKLVREASEIAKKC